MGARHVSACTQANKAIDLLESTQVIPNFKKPRWLVEDEFELVLKEIHKTNSFAYLQHVESLLTAVCTFQQPELERCRCGSTNFRSRILSVEIENRKKKKLIKKK